MVAMERLDYRKDATKISVALDRLSPGDLLSKVWGQGWMNERPREGKEKVGPEAKALSAPVVGTQASLHVHDTPIPDWDARRMHRPPLRPHW